MLNIKNVSALLKECKSYIDDDCRCDEETNRPSMCVTIATTDGKDWTWQTGDNSFSGSCYHHPHWAVVYLFRDSNCRELAREAVEELLDQVEMAV